MKAAKLSHIIEELPSDSKIKAVAGKLIVKSKTGEMLGYIDFRLQEFIEDDEE
jgi:hypothetical protein